MASNVKPDVCIRDIAAVLVTNERLLDNRLQFCHWLKVNQADVYQVEAGFRTRTESPTEFFYTVLKKWIENQKNISPIVGDILKILEDNDYIDLKEKLAEKHRNDQNIVDTQKVQHNENKIEKPHIKHKWWPKKQSLVNSFLKRKYEDKPLIEKIYAYLTNKEVSATVINQHCSLTGLGGVGKTSLARWFAIHYENMYNYIIWIDCGERSLYESFKSLSKSLEVDPIRDSLEHISTACFKLLLPYNCLFIFDNAECYIGPQGIRNAIPNYCGYPNAFHTLITSRARKWGNEQGYGKIQEFHLETFNRDESIAFLKNHVKFSFSDNEFWALAEALHDFPLALQIALAYLNSRFKAINMSEYITQLSEFTKIMHDKHNLDDYDKTMFKAMMVSVTKIEEHCEHGGLANTILAYLSCLAPDNLEFKLFAELEQVSLNKVEDSISLLQNYSLIIVDVTSSRISIHRVLQKFLLEANKDKQIEIYKKIFSLESETLCKYKLHPYIAARDMEKLKPDCNKVRKELHDILSLIDLVREERLDEAIALSEISLELSENKFGSLFNNGLVCFLAKQYTKALIPFEQIDRELKCSEKNEVLIYFSYYFYPSFATLYLIMQQSMKHLNMQTKVEEYSKKLNKLGIENLNVEEGIQIDLNLVDILSACKNSKTLGIKGCRLVLDTVSSITQLSSSTPASEIYLSRATFVDKTGKRIEVDIAQAIPKNISNLSVSFILSNDNHKSQMKIDYEIASHNFPYRPRTVSIFDCDAFKVDNFHFLSKFNELKVLTLLNKGSNQVLLDIDYLPSTLEYLNINNIIISDEIRKTIDLEVVAKYIPKQISSLSMFFGMTLEESKSKIDVRYTISNLYHHITTNTVSFVEYDCSKLNNFTFLSELNKLTVLKLLNKGSNQVLLDLDCLPSTLDNLELEGIIFSEKIGNTIDLRDPNIIPKNISNLNVSFRLNTTGGKSKIDIEYRAISQNSPYNQRTVSFVDYDCNKLDKLHFLNNFNELKVLQLLNPNSKEVLFDINCLPSTLECLKLEGIQFVDKNGKTIDLEDPQLFPKTISYLNVSFRLNTTKGKSKMDINYRAYSQNSLYNQRTVSFVDYDCIKLDKLHFLNNFNELKVLQLLNPNSKKVLFDINCLPSRLQYLKLEGIQFVDENGKTIDLEDPQHIPKNITNLHVWIKAKNGYNKSQMIIEYEIIYNHNVIKSRFVEFVGYDCIKLDKFHFLNKFTELKQLQLLNPNSDPVLLDIHCLPLALKNLEICNIAFSDKRSANIFDIDILKINDSCSQQVLKILEHFSFKQLRINSQVLDRILQYLISNQQHTKATEIVKFCLTYFDQYCYHSQMNEFLIESSDYSGYYAMTIVEFMGLRLKYGLLQYWTKNYNEAQASFFHFLHIVQVTKPEFWKLLATSKKGSNCSPCLGYSNVAIFLDDRFSEDALHFLFLQLHGELKLQQDISYFSNCELMKIECENALSSVDINLNFIPRPIKILKIEQCTIIFKKLEAVSEACTIEFHCLKTLEIKNVKFVGHYGEVLEVLHFNKILHNFRYLQELTVSSEGIESRTQTIDFSSLPESLSKLKIFDYPIKLSTSEYLSHLSLVNTPILGNVMIFESFINLQTLCLAKLANKLNLSLLPNGLKNLKIDLVEVFIPNWGTYPSLNILEVHGYTLTKLLEFGVLKPITILISELPPITLDNEVKTFSQVLHAYSCAVVEGDFSCSFNFFEVHGFKWDDTPFVPLGSKNLKFESGKVKSLDNETIIKFKEVFK